MESNLEFLGHNACEVFRFKVRTHDYVTISLDETTGTFSITGTFGAYAYSWPNRSARGDISLRDFISTSEADYIVTKFLYGRSSESSVFDGDKTREIITRKLLKARLLGDITKEAAREAYNALDSIDWDSPDSIIYSWGETLREFDDEPTVSFCYDMAPNPKYLRDVLLPDLIKWLQTNPPAAAKEAGK